MNKKMTARSRVAAIGLMIIFACAVALASAHRASAQAAGAIRLAGHVPPQEGDAQRIGPMPQDQTLSLALVLPLRNQQGLNRLLEGLYDPASPNYGKFLTPDQFAAQFSPTEQDYEAVESFAAHNGLTVTGTSPNRLVLDVAGPIGAVQQAFSTQIAHFRGRDGRDFFGPDSNPAIPAGLAGLVSAVVGLDNATVWHTHDEELDPALIGQATPYQVGSGPYGALTPVDIKKIYNLSSTSLNGAGQTLAVFELDGYKASDIAGYASYFGLPSVTLSNTLIDGASGTAGSAAAEVTLDIELQMAVAPGASKIEVYEGPNNGQGILDTYNRIATDDTAKEISSSWGAPESKAAVAMWSSENTIFQEYAAQGQSFFASSGDSGAYDNGSSLSVDDPASQPYVVGVGGTHLTPGPGQTYNKESTWNNGSASAGAGGGGISTIWSIPSWQQSVASAASEGSQTMRNVPDVSLDADPNTGYAIYLNGGWSIYGGTSCAAPLWAAFTALVNQQRLANGSSYLGFADPSLYQIGTGSRYGSDFHDINDGSTNLYYPAVTGYDDATGWGSFNGANLIADLAPAAKSTSPTNGTQTVRINAGGGATGSFAGDSGYSGGSTWTSGNTINTSGVANAAPASVYQTQRYGNFSYTVGGLTPGASYTVRLHFAETYFGTNYASGGTGSRTFNVAINGTTALTNFDIYATAGGANKAVVETFSATANSSGAIVIQFTSVVQNAIVEGIEVVPPGSTSGGTVSGQTVAQIDAGGGAVGSFSADTGFSGGSTWASGNAVSTSGVANAAPAAVYQSQRYGNFSYTIGGLTPGASYTVRLHFAETYFGTSYSSGGAGSRLFNVTVNGQAALTRFDVFATASGANKALVEPISATATSAGTITLQFTSVVQNALVEGIEVVND